MDRAALAASLDNLTPALKLARQNIGDQMGRLKDDDALRLTASDLRRQSDEKAAGLTDLPVRLVIPLGKFRLCDSCDMAPLSREAVG
jgi:hypothetical protein